MGIIIDLDQTILDTSVAEAARSQRNWSDVYSLIPKFSPYDGMIELLHDLKCQGIKSCIVTSSPSSYCQKVVKHWNIPADFKVCYHDTPKRKPNPEPHLLALKLLEEKNTDTVSIGDRDIDILSAKRAGIRSIGCLWGNTDNAELKNSSPEFIVENVEELRTTILSLLEM